jgi:hypothetical protein
MVSRLVFEGADSSMGSYTVVSTVFGFRRRPGDREAPGGCRPSKVERKVDTATELYRALPAGTRPATRISVRIPLREAAIGGGSQDDRLISERPGL